MPVLQSLPHLHNWKPIPVGSEAPTISLTAHEGTWVKSKDIKGETHLILVFFRSLADETTDDFLMALDRASTRLGELDALLFGVNQNPTEKLREYVNRCGHAFSILYDPLALTARAFRCSGRVRPYCKPSVVVIGKDGRVVLAEHGYPAVETVLQVIARLEGVDLALGRAEDVETEELVAREITAAQAIVKLESDQSPYLLIDVRTKSEHDAYHPEGCVHIPIDELPNRHAELGQNSHLILVCQTGGEASLGAAFLTSAGFNEVYVVHEGMSGWTGEEGGGAA